MFNMRDELNRLGSSVLRSSLTAPPASNHPDS